MDNELSPQISIPRPCPERPRRLGQKARSQARGRLSFLHLHPHRKSIVEQLQSTEKRSVGGFLPFSVGYVSEMASLTVSAPCNISSASNLAGKRGFKPAGVQHKFVMMNGIKPPRAPSVQSEAVEIEKKELQRRSVVFAAAVAVLGTLSGGVAMAGTESKPGSPEPRPGTPEAKKLYARICATMPTARVCHY